MLASSSHLQRRTYARAANALGEEDLDTRGNLAVGTPHTLTAPPPCTEPLTADRCACGTAGTSRSPVQRA